MSEVHIKRRKPSFKSNINVTPFHFRLCCCYNGYIGNIGKIIHVKKTNNLYKYNCGYNRCEQLGLCCIFPLNKQHLHGANQDNISDDNEKTSINELVLTETKDGQKFWELYAKSADLNDGKKQARLKNVIGNFYKDNKVVMSFTAPTAYYTDKTKDVVLTDRSKVVTNSDVTLISNQLTWSGTQDIIKANGNVKIINSDKLVTTSNFCIFNKEFTKVKVTGNSKTNVY